MRTCCMEFLLAPAEELDTGFSLRLQELALAAGPDEARQVGFLLSEGVQSMLEGTFEAAVASSLPVERKFAETKRREAPRLCSIATASRSQLLRQFHRDRVAMLERVQAAEASVLAAKRTNVRSMLWKQRPDLIENNGVRATWGEDPAPAPEALRDAVQTTMDAHAEGWSAELATARRLAQEALDRAKVKIPLRESEWAEWFAAHREEFQELMRGNVQERRAYSKRLSASPAVPAPVDRIPPPSGFRADDKSKRWLELLWKRTGWFGLEAGGRMITVLVSYLRGGMWGISLDRLATARGRDYTLRPLGVRLRRHVRPLPELVSGAVDNVYEVCVSGRVDEGRAILRIAHAEKITEPLPQPARKKRSKGAASAPGEADESADEVEKDEPAPVVDSDSSGCSADTDVDDELEECIRKDTGAFHKKLKERVCELAAHALAPALAPEPALPDAGPAAPRAASGTWNIWEGLWFYMTQTPGYTDVKIHMRVASTVISAGAWAA